MIPAPSPHSPAAGLATTFAFAVTIGGCSPNADSARADSAAADTAFMPVQYTVEDLYENVEYSGGSWSPDRTKLLVTSNASGVYNAYTIPAAGGAPQPLTSSTSDAVFAISYFPADERILYSSDQGGDDQWFFITTNERDQRYFDLYEVSVRGLERSMVFQNDSGLDVSSSA